MAHPCDSRLQHTEIQGNESLLPIVSSAPTDGERGDPRDGVEERRNVANPVECNDEVKADAPRFQTYNHDGENELDGGNDG